MPIDASIPLQARGLKLQDPMETYGRQLSIQNALLQNQSGNMELAAAKRDQETQAKLEAFLSNPDLDMNDPTQRRGLAAFGKKGMEIGKSWDESKKARLEQEKEKIGMMSKVAAFIYANPAMAEKAIVDLHARIGEDPAEDLAEISGLDENGRRQWALGHVGELDKMAQKFQEVDTGGSKRLGTVDPMTGTFTEKQRLDKTLSPDDRARMAREDDPTLMKQAIPDEAGNVTVLDKHGNIIKRYDNIGKPTATYEKAVNTRRQLSTDLDRAIVELGDAAKEGGLIDQSTGSGFGKLVDSGARFVGTATDGNVAIGKLQPIADMALKMVPRFEGPQSDKDTQSYREAAGQLADSTMPRKIRKEAALEIVRLMKARKGQFTVDGLDSGPAAPAAPGGVKFLGFE